MGGISLALTFLVFGGNSPFAYVSYLLSAYGLTVLAAAVVPPLLSVRQILHRVPLAHRYLSDQYFKVRSGLTLSFFINVCYAGFKLACAVRYVSFWDGALALYYILLCAVRVYLLRRVPRSKQERTMEQELRHYRTTGGFLFALDVALSVIAAQIVQDGRSYAYPGTLIYVAALYAFYSLTLATVNIFKYRKFNSPVLSAANVVNLTTALVSIFNLETAFEKSIGYFPRFVIAYRVGSKKEECTMLTFEKVLAAFKNYLEEDDRYDINYTFLEDVLDCTMQWGTFWG